MDADVIVVGGGLLGLASALALLERSPDLRLTLLDKEPAVAVHQSGHNSGVVHAGLYYAPGSLKASLCREGKGLLESFCQEHAIPLQRCGKLVVAVDESELDRLAELKRRGIGNGIEGLVELDATELREIEPNVRGVRALHVPETGVVDYRLVAERMSELLRKPRGDDRARDSYRGDRTRRRGSRRDDHAGTPARGGARGLRRAAGRPDRGARRRRARRPCRPVPRRLLGARGRQRRTSSAA